MEYRPAVIPMEDVEQAMQNSIATAIQERGGEPTVTTSFALSQPILMGIYMP